MLSPGQRLPGANVFPNLDFTWVLEGYYQARDNQEAKVVPRSDITWKQRSFPDYMGWKLRLLSPGQTLPDS